MEVLHRQMEQYKDQPQHAEKISYQQRLLQEDLIHIRAEISKVSTVRISGCFEKTIVKIPIRGKLYFSLSPIKVQDTKLKKKKVYEQPLQLFLFSALPSRAQNFI